MNGIDLIDRRLISVARERMHEIAVLALQGPRSVGKSTVLRQLASEHHAEIIDLDDTTQLELVRVSPTDFVGGTGPVFIDEYQRVPAILQAIKAELNTRYAPGRFVLTGSTTFDKLPRGTQSLTGRIQYLEIMPLSQGEIDGVEEDFVDTAFADHDQFRAQASTTSRTDYIARACRGGLPVAVRSTATARGRWFDAYVASSLAGDVPELSRLRQTVVLPRLLERLASQTAQVLNVTKAAAAVEIEGRTADAYVQRLADLFLVRKLPAWGRTLRARTGRAPKVHVVDSGLAARLLGLTPAKLERRDPATLTEFGHLLETFVVGEVLKQASWSDDSISAGHWRTHDGMEVDLVLERWDGAVVGIEVKARSETNTRDFAGLRALRDTLGPDFVAGFVLTAGTHGGRHDDRLYTTPIDRLWRPRTRARVRRR
jgi:uncharacterized protein